MPFVKSLRLCKCEFDSVPQPKAHKNPNRCQHDKSRHVKCINGHDHNKPHHSSGVFGCTHRPNYDDVKAFDRQTHQNVQAPPPKEEEVKRPLQIEKKLSNVTDSIDIVIKMPKTLPKDNPQDSIKLKIVKKKLPNPTADEKEEWDVEFVPPASWSSGAIRRNTKAQGTQYFKRDCPRVDSSNVSKSSLYPSKVHDNVSILERSASYTSQRRIANDDRSSSSMTKCIQRPF